MGYDFNVFEQDEKDDANWFRLSCNAWPDVFHLGVSFGWEPEGTGYGYTMCNATKAEEKELEKSWNGNYMTNDGQIVLENDSTNLVSALRHAIKYIPTDRMVVNDDDPKLTQSLNRFSGDGHEYLSKFINFIARGSFVIF